MKSCQITVFRGFVALRNGISYFYDDSTAILRQLTWILRQPSCFFDKIKISAKSMRYPSNQRLSRVCNLVRQLAQLVDIFSGVRTRKQPGIASCGLCIDCHSRADREWAPPTGVVMYPGTDSHRFCEDLTLSWYGVRLISFGCLKILNVVSKPIINPRGNRKIDQKLEKHHKNDIFWENKKSWFFDDSHHFWPTILQRLAEPL